MQEYMKLMGLKVRDLVTGAEGIVTSLSFDLYGCVQAVVNRGLDKDGKAYDLGWFDAKRLRVLDTEPIMEQPNFATVPGGERLPCPGQ